MRVLNGGTLVERRIDLDSEVNRRFGEPVDATTTLIELVREASENLTDVRFETEIDDDPYGSHRNHTLLVYGTPVGDLAEQATQQFERERAREERARIDRARRVLREAGLKR